MENKSNREKLINELNKKEKICKCCGKVFIVSYPKMYTYKRILKRKTDYYCSWTCFNKGEIKKTRKPYRKKAK